MYNIPILYLAPDSLARWIHSNNHARFYVKSRAYLSINLSCYITCSIPGARRILSSNHARIYVKYRIHLAINLCCLYVIYLFYTWHQLPWPGGYLPGSSPGFLWNPGPIGSGYTLLLWSNKQYTYCINK